MIYEGILFHKCTPFYPMRGYVCATNDVFKGVAFAAMTPVDTYGRSSRFVSFVAPPVVHALQCRDEEGGVSETDDGSIFWAVPLAFFRVRYFRRAAQPRGFGKPSVGAHQPPPGKVSKKPEPGRDFRHRRDLEGRKRVEGVGTSSGRFDFASKAVEDESRREAKYNAMTFRVSFSIA